MKTSNRTLVNNSVVIENEVREVRLRTKCCDKWILMDAQTGEVYKPSKSVDSKYDWDKVAIDPVLVSDTINKLSKL